MNNDLISRSELKKAFNKWWGCDSIPASVVEDLIDEAPSVKPSLNLDNITDEEVEKFKVIWQRANSKGLLAINEGKPQGEWKFIQGVTTQGLLKCPFCDYRDYHKTNSNYFAKCGADMRKGNDND